MELMESSCTVPPGFRFHPTEEELVAHYLKRKVNSQKIDLDVIVDVDLYRIEPWDIQDRCKLGYEEQNEWYFFSYKDRKYPTGTRTNRATAAGFWKATGRDKAVLSKAGIIGMRKTLVFYKGRAPNGRKTDWIMHEYRLQTSEHGPPQEEGWVVCRAFKKPTPNHQQVFEASCWDNSKYNVRTSSSSHYRTLLSYPSCISTTDHLLNSSGDLPNQGITNHSQPAETFKFSHNPFESPMVEIPKLDSPSSISASFTMHEGIEDHENSILGTEWKSLDGMLTSQVIVSSSSYAYTSIPLVLKNDHDLDAQNHMMSHVLDSFCDM